MRTSGIGRIMQQVGGMLRGPRGGATRARSRTATPRRRTAPRTRTTTPTGGSGGLGRAVKRFLR